MSETVKAINYEPREGVDYLVDLYQLAGVSPDADSQVIKKALNERALEYHPDRLEGMAPKFIEEGKTVTVLLNRARVILMDPDTREEYDELLSEWKGPVSVDGTPIISLDRYRELEMETKTPDEVEVSFAAIAEKVIQITGYSEDRLTFLESLMASGNISQELRSQYEAALLEKDAVLAVQESERAKLLGLPDRKDRDVSTLEHSKDIEERLGLAKDKVLEEVRWRALGGVATQLALLSGDEVGIPHEVNEIVPANSELPHYFEEQAEKIREIAHQREAITDKRLENLQPVYPEEELQVEFQEKIILGIGSGEDFDWLSFEIDLGERQPAQMLELPEDIKDVLDSADYKKVISKSYAIITVPHMQNIGLVDLIGVTLGKYVNKFRESGSED
jgi:curved DNA-binding protein CbpA